MGVGYTSGHLHESGPWSIKWLVKGKSEKHGVMGGVMRHVDEEDSYISGLCFHRAWDIFLLKEVIVLVSMLGIYMRHFHPVSRPATILIIFQLSLALEFCSFRNVKTRKLEN